jgi:glycerol-3-phosphate O-acyltransferase
MTAQSTARFSLARLVYPLLSWMLRAVVREQVLPADPKMPDGPVCYVLESNALSNVLILQQACMARGFPPPLAPLSAAGLSQSRSLLALANLKGVFARRGDMRDHLHYLTQMAQAVDKSEQDDIQFVPVSIFLGRAPDKQSGLFGIMFSENWTIAGRFRRLIALIIHGHGTLVQFSKPISVRQVLDEELGQARTVRKISRVLRVHFRLARTAAVGPDLSHRRTLINEVLRTPLVRDAIKTRARKRKLSVAKVRRQARKYALEIAADSSYPVIRVAARSLSWFWNRIYNGVHVNHLDQFLEVTKGNELIYVPCHRSHIDYLLVSHLVFQNGLAVPHIAAGVNLNVPIVGPILRRAGAFYLRRSFRANPLYSAVFNEYLDTIFASGVSMEYFIEGGRSRTGRLLQPKTGMLMMTVRSYLRHRDRPVMFVPIYVGYERLVEGTAYLNELSGGRKKTESLGGIMRSFRVLRENFGQVHVSFGKPVKLSEFLDLAQPDWREQDPESDLRPPWLATTVEALAKEIQVRVNQTADINPINLLALVLLSTPKNALSESDLIEQIDLLRGLIRALPYDQDLTITDMPADQIVVYGESLDFVNRQPHALGDIIRCDETSALLLSYQRNNVLHVVAVYSWVACVFLNNVHFSRKDLLRVGKIIYPFLKSELFLHFEQRAFADECEKCIKLLGDCGLLVKSDRRGMLQRAPGGTAQSLQLKMLAEPIFSSLERYYITVALLVKNGSGTLSAGELETLCHQSAQRMSLIYTFDSPEFFDRSLFKHFIRLLRNAGIVNTSEDGKLTFDRALENVIQDAKVILSKEVRHTIWQISAKQEPKAESEQAAA